jgi:uncharacterized protein YigE (DUF2233 family)
MKSLIILILLLLIASKINSQEKANNWTALEAGLHLNTFNSSQTSYVGDSRITVLRVDPELFEIEIYCKSYFKDKDRTLKEWAEEFNLLATINAGMYAKDYLTSVGYLKSRNHINNSLISKKYNCIFACSPLDKNVPQAQIIDLRCQNFLLLQNKYTSFSQSIRMIDCQQKNVWQQQSQKWSIAALGMAKSGDILLMHCRSPYSVHDFINIILTLPLYIYNAMYLEGGAEAGMYFSVGETEMELMGIHEAELVMGERKLDPPPLPNIIGIKRKVSEKQ